MQLLDTFLELFLDIHGYVVGIFDLVYNILTSIILILMEDKFEWR